MIASTNDGTFSQNEKLDFRRIQVCPIQTSSRMCPLQLSFLMKARRPLIERWQRFVKRRNPECLYMAVSEMRASYGQSRRQPHDAREPIWWVGTTGRQGIDRRRHAVSGRPARRRDLIGQARHSSVDQGGPVNAGCGHARSSTAISLTITSSTARLAPPVARRSASRCA